MNTIYDYLKGQWHFHRKIIPHGYAEGMAIFTPVPENPNRLYYLEQGQFYLHHQQNFKIQREYIYNITENHIMIYHARAGQAGEFFIQLTFPYETREAQASHLCLKDFYHAQFYFLNEQSFQIDYQVKGPKKNYQIQTQYLRN